MENKTRYLVTSALPYANGPLHIGHAAGAYLPADVYVRYLKMRGEEVVFICGTDEHGTPISVAAEQEGVSPREIVDRYHKIQEDAFNTLQISFDNFSGTARKVHFELSQQFFTSALKNGFIHEETVKRPYSVGAKRFLPDRYVRGTCPHCKSPDQRGDQCEKCGKQLEPHELLDSYSILDKQKPEMRDTKHWFFELSKFTTPLKKWITEECNHWPENAKHFALGWINEGLTDRAITRDMSWGIPVPLSHAEGKVIYVWFEAPIGYVSSTKEWAEKQGKPDLWKHYWKKKEGASTRIVHFIGKDNIAFHTIIWPATLLAEGTYNLPWLIASNEYLNLEGQKMSTSRNWVVWLHDILAEFDVDAVRYGLIAINPETSDCDFNFTEFKEHVNKELIGTLGNFIHRTLTFIEKKGGTIPKHATLDEDDKIILTLMEKAPDEIGQLIFDRKLKAAQQKLLAVAAAGNVYFQKKEPWKGKESNALYICANLTASLSVLMEPFLPESGAKVRSMLKMKDGVRWEDAKKPLITGGHKIGKIEALYTQIEDEDVEEFKKKYLSGKKTGETKVTATEPKKEETKAAITYEEFAKVEMKVGVVKTVKDNPNADKLYALTVDVGEGADRTLVAGLKGHYTKEQLIGRKIVVVANLAPAKLRGLESKGMLLAADDGQKVVLVSPAEDISVGAKIR
ncbi:Methionine--tRNA ligase [uncultured archaeon]|nr:Methionine--tRNA ligase [uncultured archaeon]